jgi:REP element-mobilizing transposase RayT
LRVAAGQVKLGAVTKDRAFWGDRRLRSYHEIVQTSSKILRIRRCKAKKIKKLLKRLKQNGMSLPYICMRICLRRIFMRMLRILIAGALYHVIIKANRQEKVFHNDAMRELFMGVVEKAKKKFNFELLNFVVMGNHVHLLIRPGEGESLSKIMQWIMPMFTRAWNRANGYRTGRLWGGPLLFADSR